MTLREDRYRSERDGARATITRLTDQVGELADFLNTALTVGNLCHTNWGKDAREACDKALGVDHYAGTLEDRKADEL